ncbi:MAG: single-stranded-DNA-specific exonuclease RecJ [Bacillota bacterium]
MRSWRPPDPVLVPPALLDAVGSAPLAEMLYRRGFVAPAAALAFLNGAFDLDGPGLPDLEAGVAELARAVIARERICVYGDYDTDGVTAAALLVGLLRMLGADVTCYIPDRFRDGYGMNERAVAALAGEGTQLLLTCDCGIRSVAEVALARQRGMRVVVTDHHELGLELPEAEAVINPKRLPEAHPCRMLPGVGTAYLVARRLLAALGRSPAEADRWLDLVAVGIIGDVVPLTGANRELGRRGLSRLNSSPCEGLQALIQVAGLTGHLTEEEVAFQLVPRLNSAGRLDDARLAVRLLLATDPAEASALAARLDELNQERRRLTTAVVEGAAAEAGDGGQAILLYRPEWHEGVLGIAAGRLAEERGIPVLLMTRRHGSNLLVGSARSPAGRLPLHEALDACSEHLVRHGGHAAAAGFSLLEERFPAFRAALLEEVRRRSCPDPAREERAADLSLPLAQAGRALYEELRRAAPYGEGNPAPVLYAADVALLSARPIGAGDRHLRLVLKDGEAALIGVWWGAGPTPPEPQRCELFYRLALHRWNGEEQLQVVVLHLGPAPAPDPAATPLQGPARPAVRSRPALVDRRGVDLPALRAELPSALFLAEGRRARAEGAVDRYGLRQADDLVLLTTPPGPRLLDEALAITGARRVVMAWPSEAAPDEERFLPSLMRLLAEAMQVSPWVSLSGLAAHLGELEPTVRAGLETLAESHLLAVVEEVGDRLKLRKRTDGRSIRNGAALDRLKGLLGESRSYRRFLRTAGLEAIARTLR